ncbi:MAG: prepilin-type N-terminal cleavage/methylation domain-containing protein [Sulfurisoma sp.]|nr:prepilin-type N-terminal cleavage/methylation domain-containing protein [Sulfurisoma sp.]
MSISRHPARERGLTLIELIIFIFIVSVALIGMLSVLNITVMHSADPMIRKKMLAITESLLEEVAMHPFTYCDPSDAAVTTATSTAGCTTLPSDLTEVLGTETGETRGHVTNPFNNPKNRSQPIPFA